MVTDDLKYPIGKFQPQPYSEARLQEWIHAVKYLPQFIEYAIQNLDEAQLETPYRPDGWTVKQVVHHVADSHMNAYIRFKLGLTEDNPTIKPYDEAAWAKLSDTSNLPINLSLTILHALHARWFEILNNMSKADFNRTVFHPEKQAKLSLWELLGNYAWHGKHHTRHITALRERMSW